MSFGLKLKRLWATHQKSKGHSVPKKKKKLDHLPVTGVLLLGNLHRSTFFEAIVSGSRTKGPLQSHFRKFPWMRFTRILEMDRRKGWICEGKDPIG